MEIGQQIIDQQVRDKAHSLKEWLNTRFHNQQTDDVFKRIKLVDICLRLKDKDALIKFWKEEP